MTRYSPTDVNESRRRDPMYQNPYPSNNTAPLSDPRLTDEVLGQALREAASRSRDQYIEVIQRAAILAAEKELKA